MHQGMRQRPGELLNKLIKMCAVALLVMLVGLSSAWASLEAKQAVPSVHVLDGLRFGTVG
jgi:hypothetical protein